MGRGEETKPSLQIHLRKKEEGDPTEGSSPLLRALLLERERKAGKKRHSRRISLSQGKKIHLP